jgi:hypothetical protein
MSYSEDEFNFDEKDDDFVAEFAARERVGSGKPTFIDIQIDIKKGKKGRLSLKNELTPDQLFLFDLQKNYYKYEDDIELTIDDIELIKNIVLKMPHIEYKNPIAFLFGYYLLNKNKKSDEIINKELITRIKSILKGISGIELEDLIRYARMIHKYDLN